MSECSELWTRMLLFCCFCLFVVSDAVDVKAETEYQSSVDPSKELLYVVVVCLRCVQMRFDLKFCNLCIFRSYFGMATVHQWAHIQTIRIKMYHFIHTV